MRTNKPIQAYIPENDTPKALSEVAKHLESYEASPKWTQLMNSLRASGQANSSNGGIEMSNSHVTHAELREFGDKIEERFEKRFDKLDSRMDRMDANIAEMSKGIVALTAKVDQIPMQLENQKLQTKLDIEGMLKEQNREMKNDARYRTTITIAGIGLIVALIQAIPLIINTIPK